jgi:Sensors of blue-light using FAD
MIQLAYFSSVSPGRPAADRESILATSRRNNLRHGITGMLIYSKGNFLQILEGSHDPVLRVFDAIQRDPRHTGVTEIFQQAADQRNFPETPMGFHDLGAPGSAVDGYGEFLREHFDLGALQPTATLALFNLFKPGVARAAVG